MRSVENCFVDIFDAATIIFHVSRSCRRNHAFDKRVVERPRVAQVVAGLARRSRNRSRHPQPLGPPAVQDAHVEAAVHRRLSCPTCRSPRSGRIGCSARTSQPLVSSRRAPCRSSRGTAPCPDVCRPARAARRCYVRSRRRRNAPYREHTRTLSCSKEASRGARFVARDRVAALWLSARREPTRQRVGIELEARALLDRLEQRELVGDDAPPNLVGIAAGLTDALRLPRRLVRAVRDRADPGTRLSRSPTSLRARVSPCSCATAFALRRRPATVMVNGRRSDRASRRRTARGTRPCGAGSFSWSSVARLHRACAS